eukprot:3117648-Pyramimonas_sp.AAC.1
MEIAVKDQPLRTPRGVEKVPLLQRFPTMARIETALRDHPLVQTLWSRESSTPLYVYAVCTAIVGRVYHVGAVCGVVLGMPLLFPLSHGAITTRR